MTTDQKGAIAEWSIIAAAVRGGYGVYRPVFDVVGTTSSSSAMVA